MSLVGVAIIITRTEISSKRWLNIKGAVFEIDYSTGLLEVNDVLIGLWTRGQSDISGSLFFPGELLSSGK
jgi:hypothetical protein